MQQDYPAFELLIVDDGSMDGTNNYLAGLAAQNSKVKHIRLNTNIGLPAYSMVMAYRQAQGALLAFVADDCRLKSNHLSRLTSEFQKAPSIGMAYGNTVFHSVGRQVTLGRPMTIEELNCANDIGNSATMVSRAAIEAVGCCDPHIILKRVSDWDLWLRIWRQFAVVHIDEIIADEFGPSLPDSLGRATHIYLDLVRKYMNHDRSGKLKPELIESGDYSSTDMPFELSEIERQQIGILTLEHYIAVSDTKKIVAAARQVLSENPPGASRIWQQITSRSDGAVNDGDLALFAMKYYLKSQGVRQNYMAELERLIAVEGELKDIHEQYHSLKRSTSWRLTKPLRELKALIQR